MNRPVPDHLFVSLHIPKTGGISLFGVLQQQFPTGFNTAYPELSVDSAKIKSPGPVTCIHGHDIVKQFGSLIAVVPNQRWITFLREPLASAISYYHFAKKSLNKDPDNPLFEDKGLDAWLLNDKPASWPFPPGYPNNRFQRAIQGTKRKIDQFDFVGITERFDESMLCMYKTFGWQPIHYKEHNKGAYSPPDLDPDIVACFKKHNQPDYELYAYATNRLDEMVRSFGNKFSEELKAFQASNTCS